MPKRSKRVLIADDDRNFLSALTRRFEDEGFEVFVAINAADAINTVTGTRKQIDLVLLDVRMPQGDVEWQEDDLDDLGPVIAAAREIRRKRPNTSIFGFSWDASPDRIEWFESYCNGFLRKDDFSRDKFKKTVRSLLNDSVETERPSPRSLIVHGSGESVMLALKNFVQNRLNWREPIVASETLPNGQCVYDSEIETASYDVVFLILCSKDKDYDFANSSYRCGASRQELILTAGFLIGRFHPSSTRILVLHDGELYIPAAIAGLTYIDVSGSIPAAAETLRRHLSPIDENRCCD